MASSGEGDAVAADLPFRQVAQRLPTPCWISDADGNIIWVNDAWIAYTGKTAEALAREGLKALHDPEVFPRVAARWAKTKCAGEPDEMIFPLRARDGSLRPFHTRVVPLRDAEGRITRWFGTNADISQQAEAEARAIRTEAELLENEARLRLATEAAGVGVWEWRLDTNEMIYSARAKAICGFAEDQPVTYEMVVAATHPEDFPVTSAQAARALDPVIRDRSPYEYRIIRPDGDVRRVTACGEAIFEVGDDGVERAVRYVGTLVDITQRQWAEDAVRTSERRLHLALRAGRMAAWQVDASGELAPNPEINALIGLPEHASPRLADLVDRYMPGDLERIRAAAAEARERGERHFEVEYRFRCADDEIRWFYVRAEALVASDGRPAGIIGVVMDITDRKAGEEQLKFLAREVDHRANNLLSIVQGAVALSKAQDVEDLRAVITGRVHALARAHQLLSEARWTGADLRRLILEEMAPFTLGDGPERVRIDGPELALQPLAAQSVAMVLHELATNAAKHGALSRKGGQVEVVWTVEPDERLRLRWAERGGPMVTTPTRRGFGTSVIRRALGGALRGETKLDWRPEGVVCLLELPVGT